MKKKNLLTTLILFVFTFLSCSDDQRESNLTQKNEQGFTLSYFVENSNQTRSSIDLEAGEDQINSFYILFFENTTGGTGLFVEGIDAKASYNGTLSSSGNLEITFPENSSLTNSKSYVMLLCANLEEYTDIKSFEDINSFCIGKTENEVKLLLQQISGITPGSGEEQIDAIPISSTDLPMSTRIVKEVNAREVVAELIRTVVRFDVYVEVEGYELVSTSIWNAYTEGYVWEGNFTNYQAPRTERFYGVKTTSNKIVGSLYSFENYVREPEQADKVSTCLILGLENQSTRKVEYFRTNVNVFETSSQQIKRNNVYTTIIKGVTRPGHNTERKAYEDDEIILEGDYLFVIPNNNLTFPASGGSTGELKVLSSGPWKATVKAENTTGYFNSYPNPSATFSTTYEGENGTTFGLTVKSLLNDPYASGSVTYTFSLKNKPSVTQTITIHQNAMSETAPMVHVGVDNLEGSLYDMTVPYAYSYVYNMGTYLRETTVEDGMTLEPFEFISKGSHAIAGDEKWKPHTKTSLYQVISNPGSSNAFHEIIPWLKEDKRHMLMFSNVLVESSNSNTAAAALASFSSFLTGYSVPSYFVAGINVVPEQARYFYKKNGSVNMNNLVIQYLLDGPYGTVNPDNIALFSAGVRNAGMDITHSNVPNTFIPIIMSKSGSKEYCVLGIDVYNRFIWLSDVGIMGAREDQTSPNVANYQDENSDNTIFFKNLMAWIVLSVTEEGFLLQFGNVK